MVSIPSNVLDLMKRPDTGKILVTASKEGQPHAIVCGSFFALDDSTIGVGEVLMATSKKYMSENSKVEILVTSGMEAYGINATVDKRITEGPVLVGLNEKLDKVHLHANAVWTFKANAVFNESAGPGAGKKIA